MIDIIKTGQAINSLFFTDTVYDINGFLIKFEYNYENYYRYYALEDFLKDDQERARNNASSGYWLITEFDKYLRREIDYVQLTNPNNGNEFNLFELANEGESIEVEAVSFGGEYYDRYYQQKKYSFTLENDPSTGVVKLYDQNNDGIIDGLDAVPHENVTTEYISLENSTGGKFYKNNFYLKTIALPDNAYKRTLARYATLIGFKIHSIEHDVFPKLIENESQGSQVLIFVNQLQNSWQNSNDIIGSLEVSEFLQYYNSLYNFYENTYFRTFEGVIGDDKLMYLIQILPPSAISLIDIDLRIRILEQMVKGLLNTSTEILDILTFGTPIKPLVFTGSDNGDEILALKIIQSVTPSEANYFLTQLNNKKPDGIKSLFVILYEKIDDKYLKYFGDDNKGLFVTKLYEIWLDSDFNPYKEFNNFPDNNGTNTIPLYQSFLNNPVILDYTSEKLFGFYIDDMDFTFEGNKIKVKKYIKTTSYVDTGTGVVDMGSSKTVDLGTYDYFQAISFKNFSEQDLAVKIPIVAVQSKETACLPLFFLKYIDDYGDRQDTFTAVETSLDVALTFTGIGNLTKLRHLRHVTKVGRYLYLTNPGFTAEEIVCIVRGVQGLAASIEVSASVVSLVYNAYSNGCEIYKNGVTSAINDANPSAPIPEQPTNNDYEWCKKLDRWLFWAQILSGGVDLASETIASVNLRKASKEIKEEGYPAEWVNDPDYQPVMSKIDDLTDMTAEFNAFRNRLDTLGFSEVKNKFNTLDEGKQLDFYYDFRNSDSKLAQLNADTNLINSWDEIKTLTKHRNNIVFLKWHNYIKNDINLLDHILKGQIYNGKSYGIHSKIYQNQYVEILSIVNPPTNLNKHYRATVSAKNTAGIFITKLNRKGTAPGHSTIFRDDWDTQEKLIEEISMAFTTKYYTGTWNKYRGIMSDGTVCEMGIDNLGPDGLFVPQTVIKTVYPLK